MDKNEAEPSPTVTVPLTATTATPAPEPTKKPRASPNCVDHLVSRLIGEGQLSTAVICPLRKTDGKWTVILHLLASQEFQGDTPPSAAAFRKVERNLSAQHSVVLYRVYDGYNIPTESEQSKQMRGEGGADTDNVEYALMLDLEYVKNRHSSLYQIGPSLREWATHVPLHRLPRYHWKGLNLLTLALFPIMPDGACFFLEDDGRKKCIVVDWDVAKNNAMFKALLGDFKDMKNLLKQLDERLCESYTVEVASDQEGGGIAGKSTQHEFVVIDLAHRRIKINSAGAPKSQGNTETAEASTLTTADTAMVPTETLLEQTANLSLTAEGPVNMAGSLAGSRPSGPASDGKDKGKESDILFAENLLGQIEACYPRMCMILCSKLFQDRCREEGIRSFESVEAVRLHNPASWTHKAINLLTPIVLQKAENDRTSATMRVVREMCQLPGNSTALVSDAALEVKPTDPLAEWHNILSHLDPSPGSVGSLASITDTALDSGESTGN